MAVHGCDLRAVFCVAFVLEEVTFRGALDTHVSEATSGDLAPCCLRVLPSVLYGVPLAFAWRRGGTLVLPAAAPALFDAWRNALFA
jgi:hypothetical protein